MKIHFIQHRGENRIKIEFKYNTESIEKLKMIPGCRWSLTHKSWHIPCTEEAMVKLKEYFPEVETEKPEKDVSAEIKKPEEKPPESVKVQKQILIHILGRKIIIRMSKNEDDVNFIKNLKYSSWDKKNYYWVLPNYAGNLELLKNYFGERINSITISETIYKNNDFARAPEHNEILLIQCNNGRLKLIGTYSMELNEALKTIHYKIWDRQNKWWTFPYTESYHAIVKDACERSGLKLSFEKEEGTEKRKGRISPMDVPNFRECPEEFILKLKELRYSESTIRTYSDLFREFINYHFRYDIKTIDEPTIIAYLRYLVMERKVSPSYQNQAINAIKFYYERVLGGNRKFFFVERPLKEKTLPVVLSEIEVKRILNHTPNIKHKAILMVAYSAGLRVSEIVNLKITDIDSERMQIRIRLAKGNKDRYTLLSTKTLTVLRTYFTQYRPKEWLFEGVSQQQYSIRSVQKILKTSARAAGIQKTISIHTLRHSFATHLMEQGTDIRYIQNLLGHCNVKTTEVYTHISNHAMARIKSPLDRFDL